MMPGDYLICGFVTLSASALLTICLTVPFSVWLAHQVGAIDLPGDLKVHSQPIPRLGGVGIVLAFLIVFVMMELVHSLDFSIETYAAVGSALVVVLLGIVDDIRGLPQAIKFILEGMVAVGFMWALADLFTWWLAVAAWFGLIGLTNAYNFIDGLDGLASGLAVINFTGLSVLFFLDDMFLLSLLTLVGAGACLGFLRFNWQPAQVFMGDGGALGIGFLIASLSVLYVGVGEWSWSRIVAAILVAALPVGDVVFTFVRRLVGRQSLLPGDLFPGDRFHFYDQMRANAGLSTKSTVIITYKVGFTLATFGVVAYFLPSLWAVVVGLLGVALLISLAFRYKISIPRLEEV